MGETRLIRNMSRGAALSLNIRGLPSPGPHHRLCRPKVNCQSENVRPTYASSRASCDTAGCGVEGGNAGKKLTVCMVCLAVKERAGILGAVCSSPRTYATQRPRVAYDENPLTVFQPSP